MEFGLKKPVKKLLLVIPVRTQEDLLPVVESEGWHTVKDLFKNGHFLQYQLERKLRPGPDEIPWKATEEELKALNKARGRVVVIMDGKYNISEKIDLYTDSDGSVYVLEGNVERFFEPD